MILNILTSFHTPNRPHLPSVSTHTKLFTISDAIPQLLPIKVFFIAIGNKNKLDSSENENKVIQ